MSAVISLRGVGIRFRAPRHTRYGYKPRLVGSRRQTVWGLRDVSLEVERGEFVGLIGPNGSGKTTLLRTIAGIYRPDEGEIRRDGRVAPLLSFDGDLKPGLSGWENIALSGVLLGLSRRQTKDVATSVADFAGLGDSLDTEVRVYSTGMKARLGFAVAAFSQPDVLVLDEAMTVGDEDFKERSGELIRGFVSEGKTVIMASHEIPALAAVAHRLVRLDRGAVAEMGTPARVAEHYLAGMHSKALSEDHELGHRNGKDDAAR